MLEEFVKDLKEWEVDFEQMHYSSSMGLAGMSDPPGHIMLFCKLQKGGLTDAKRSQRGTQSPF